MGVSFSAKVVVGIKIDPRQLVDTILVRGCDHPQPKTRMSKFCGECGKPAGTPKEVLKPFVVTRFPDEGINEAEEVAGFRIVRGTHYDGDAFRTPTFLASHGVCVHMDEDPKRVADFDFHAAAYDMQDRLTPLGLWDASMFGIWCVPYVSY